jgi:phospholipid/cholesterol/gamma-HCH transport system permease protein
LTSREANVTLSSLALHPMATLNSNLPEAPRSSLPSLFSDVLKSQLLALQNYSFLVGDSIAKIFTPPHYTEDVLDQMDVIGVGSLPIILLTGLFIGGVMVINTAAQFQRFGETSLTGDVVAIALVRELGPTITALLVAGRNASGIASELGSMVVTEQVDAMRALGTDPVRKLVVPRLIATVLTLPLLTAVADLVGLFGGFLVSHFTLHLSASEFWHRSIHALVLGDLVQGMVKPLVFAAIIATVGCYQGLQARGGTEGVGRATTTAVVVASVAILVSDFFLGKLLIFWFLQ